MNFNDARSGAGKVIGLLDVGTSKIVCMIAGVGPGSENGVRAERGSPPVAKVLGIGHQKSSGIKAGVVIDMDEAETAIRAAVSQAERQAGVQLREVHLAISCGRLRSSNFAASAQVEGVVVRDDDVERGLQGGRAFAEKDGRSLVHLNTIGFRLDGAGGIRDPRGLAGRKLSMDLHAVTADDSPLRNFMIVLERCYLSVAGLVASPYANALAATTPEERQQGVICIDLGGGKTSFSIFAEGHFLHTDAIAIGGDHISFDISRTLSTPLVEAERIKTLYGTMVCAASDSHEIISFPVVESAAQEGGQMLYQTTKAQLHQYVRPRVESTLTLVMERVESCGLAGYGGSRVVLTGGAAQLVGLGEYAASYLGRSVRVSRPTPIGGMPASICSPAFSTVIGLLHAAMDPQSGVMAYQDRDALGADYMGRVGQWLRESF